jgi:PleD family two-component response regulator
LTPCKFPIRPPGGTSLTVSIGFSYLVPSSDKEWQTLTEQADQALYHAKSQGRACTLAYR